MRLKRRNFMASMLGTGLLGSTGTLRADERNSQTAPNIMIILADDMGYSDIGCYGGEISTPNLDRLAANGVRFRNFYNTARCCPTRASLLTGLYPHQAGMGWMTAAQYEAPGYAGELNKQCVTIAEVLRQRGYGTYAAGKWHVTADEHIKTGEQDSWPIQRGFDRFFGTLKGAGSFFNPASLMLDNNPIQPGNEFYYTDAISEYTCQFIEEHQANTPERPFFSYVAYTAPHWPLHAKPKDINKYKEVYRGGWDKARQQRYDRMLKMGVISKECTLSERHPDVPAWNTTSPQDQALFARRMAVYAAQVDCMDQGIGQIIETLEKTGQLENTLLMFLSDNGACAEEFMSKKTTLENMGSAESDGSYYTPWANVSNTPFRMYKQLTHEGGIATPLVVHWPKKVTRKGVFSDQIGHVVDLMATAVDVSGATYPTEFAGHRIPPMEGLSLYHATLLGTLERRALFFEHQSSRAVRVGDWKLVSLTKKSPWELYHLSEDASEGVDLANHYPEKVKLLADLWEKHAKRTLILPLDDRSWGERISAFEKNKPLSKK